MKIIDITSFASKNKIKKELNSVYVKHILGGIVYVTTDAFRLVEITLIDDKIKEFIKEGFYKLDIWKLIVKELNKKEPDFDFVSKLFDSNYCKDGIFPHYEKVLTGKFRPADFNKRLFDSTYFCEMLDMVDKVSSIEKRSKFNSPKYHEFNPSDYTEKDDLMIFYSKNGVRLALMPRTK